MRVCLASASPRRLELLRGVGIEPLVLVSGADESLLPGERAEAHVQRLAREKGEAVAARLLEGTGLPERVQLPEGAELLIAADTVVVLDGEILGKPGTAERAAAMLTRLSGREHRVLTGLALLVPARGEWRVALCETRVFFRELDSRQIREYVSADTVTDCAGAYRIQGRGVFLLDPERGIQGSWSNVVGLPLETLFSEAGLLGCDLLKS